MDLLANYSDESSKQSPLNIPLPNEKLNSNLRKGKSLEEEYASFAKLFDGETMGDDKEASTSEQSVAKRKFSESGTSQSYAFEIQSSSSSCSSSRSNSVEPGKKTPYVVIDVEDKKSPEKVQSGLPSQFQPRKDSGKGSSTSRSRSRSLSHSPKRSKKPSKEKRSRSGSRDKSKRSRSHSQSRKSRSRSRDKHRDRKYRSKKEKRRHRSSSRSKRSSSRSKKRSSSRHRSPHTKRSRSKSRDRKRNKDSKSSRERRHRSKDKSHRRHKHSSSRRSRSRTPRRRRSRSPRYHGSRSKSRSRSYSPRRSTLSSIDAYQKKISGTFAKKSKPLTFREKMRQELIKASKMLTEQGGAESKEQSTQLPLAVTESTTITPQIALLQTMAAMHQKAQEMTGVAVPKYYNPAAVNPLKYAEQFQKRKLLWSKNKEKKEETGGEHWQATAFQADDDGKMSAKFRKLMGMKHDESIADDALTEEQRAKREEVFNRLDKDYEFARMSTHTHRGVGLGFASQGMTIPQFPQP